MPILNQVSNIPGMLTEFKDGGLKLRKDPSIPTTGSILVLGTALDGPVLEPVAVDADTAELVFGKGVTNNRPNGATLTEAFNQLYKEGCRDIRLMRISGSVAKATIVGVSKSHQVNQNYHDILVAVEGNNVSAVGVNRFTLTHSVDIDVSSIVVKAAGEVLEGTKWSYDDETTHQISLVKDACSFGAPISVTYSYGDPAVTVTENSTAGVPWSANGGASTQTIVSAFKAAPVAGSVKVYVGGKHVLNSNYYTVAGLNLTIDKKYFRLGDGIVIDYESLVTEEIVPTIDLETFFGGSLYNRTSFEIETVGDPVTEVILYITKPVEKRSRSDEARLEYSSLNFPTFDMLANAITNDLSNGVVRASTAYPNEDTLTSLARVLETNFEGGADGVNLTKRQIFEALSGKRNEEGQIATPGAYQILENYLVDYIVPVGVYADDELSGQYEDFAYELALCAGVLSQVHLTHGIMGWSPIKKTDLLSIEQYTRRIEEFSNTYYMRGIDGEILLNREGDPFDLGGYISIVVGPDLLVTSSRLGNFYSNGALKYAAMLSRLAAKSAPTHKTFLSVSGLRYTFSYPQLKRIAAQRVVTFEARNTDNAVIVTDGVTCAQEGSDWSRIVNTKVTRVCLEDIYQAAEPFIGEPPNPAGNNALVTAIAKKLDNRMDPAIADINDYDFQLVSDPLDKLIGDSKLELSLVPPGERRKITVVVGLRKSI